MTEGLPSLADLVNGELARRQDATGERLAFTFIVDDNPDTLLDVERAVKAIESHTASEHQGRTVIINPGI